MNGDNTLTKLDAATAALARCELPNEAAQIANVAEAARKYAKKARLGLDVQNHAAELKIRAQRKAGELLVKMKENGQRQRTGGDRKSSLQNAIMIPTLADLDIEPTESARCQSMYRLPADLFEQTIAQTIAEKKELTSAILFEVANEIKREKVRQERVKRVNEIAKGNTPLETHQRYPVLYADPPWRYEHSKTTNRQIENHYPTMSLEEICALPIAEIATPDAVLFLWATSPKVEEALLVMQVWGFTYRTNLVWDKERMGMGYYARQQHELLMLGTCGDLPIPEPENRPESVQRIERDNKHSAKPEQFYDLIERMYPEYDRIELFARQQRVQWHAWGNQADGDQPG